MMSQKTTTIVPLNFSFWPSSFTLLPKVDLIFFDSFSLNSNWCNTIDSRNFHTHRQCGSQCTQNECLITLRSSSLRFQPLLVSALIKEKPGAGVPIYFQPLKILTEIMTLPQKIIYNFEKT